MKRTTVQRTPTLRPLRSDQSQGPPGWRQTRCARNFIFRNLGGGGGQRGKGRRRINLISGIQFNHILRRVFDESGKPR